MIASQRTTKDGVDGRSDEAVSLAGHLKGIAAAAAWSVAPLVGILLAMGRLNWAFSVAGGGIVSLSVFASLRVLVYKVLHVAQAGQAGQGLSPAAMTQFAAGMLAKFGFAIGVVWLMVHLHANLLFLLLGFVVAQIAVAVTVSRQMHGPAA